MSGRGKKAAISSVPAVGGSHADAVAQEKTVEDLQKELDMLKAYVAEVEATRDKFCADNILLYATWQREKIKREKIENKYHNAKQEWKAEGGAK